MRIYLAGRYSRRLELCGYRDLLHQAGHYVTSRWLDGQHQINDQGLPIGDQGEQLVEGNTRTDRYRAAELRRHFAAENLEDVRSADMLIACTEIPRSSMIRGGRHVEMGLALGMCKRVWILGPCENVFCYLPGIMVFDDFQQILEELFIGDLASERPDFDGLAEAVESEVAP